MTLHSMIVHDILTIYHKMADDGWRAKIKKDNVLVVLNPQGKVSGILPSALYFYLTCADSMPRDGLRAIAKHFCVFGNVLKKLDISNGKRGLLTATEKEVFEALRREQVYSYHQSQFGARRERILIFNKEDILKKQEVV